MRYCFRVGVTPFLIVMKSIYRKFLKLGFFTLVMSTAAQAVAQYPVRPNEKNANGERIGEWIIFYDSAYDKSFEQPDSAYYYLLTKFKDGKPLGLVESFHMNGVKNWSGYLLSLDPTIRHGKATVYYPNGNILEEAIYQYDSLHGAARIYHENGMLSAIGELRNNKKEGYWEEYYPNGNLRYKGSLVNGKEEGIWELYHENGAFKSKGLYQRGLGQGYWEYFHDNGQLASKGMLVDNNYEGQWLEYFDNGQLSEDILYKSDLKHGKYTGYYANGSLEVTGHYIGGKAHGDFIFYHDNGEKFSVGRKEKDQLVGIWKNYYPNGQLKSVGPFENGLRNGQWKFYTEDGYQESEGILVDDLWHGSATFYSVSGLVKSKGKYVKDKKEGEWIYYTDDGALIDIANYVQDMYHGPVESYFADGTLSYKGLMQNNKKEGTWVFYNDDGTSTEGSYRADLMHGHFKRYHATGELSEEGKYIDDKKEGIWNYYYSDGSLKSSGSYINGVKEGEWKYNNEEGQLQAHGYYDQGNSTGRWKYYYANGQLSKEGDELADNPLGLWHYYNEDGTKHSTGEWRNGKQHGKWTYYTDSGAISNQRTFHFDKELNFQTYYDSVNNLTYVGKIAQAREVMKLVKSAFKKEYGMGVKYSEIYELEGNVARYAKEYPKAIQWYQKALDHVLKYKADTSTWYILTLPNVGQLYWDMGNYTESAAYYQQVLDLMNKRGDGYFNKSYPTYLNFLASSISLGGDPQGAIEMIQSKVTQMEREGFDAEDVAVSRLYMVRFADDMGDQQLRLTLIDSLFDYSERVGLSAHWVLGMTAYHQGRALNKLGRSEDGLKSYTQALDMYRAIGDTVHTTFINCMMHIGDYYYSRSNYDKSLHFYSTAFQRSEQYGWQSEDVYRYSYSSVGKALFSMGNSKDAIHIATEFLKMESKSASPSEDYLSEGHLALAMAYAREGVEYYSRAEQSYKQAMAVYPKGSAFNYNYWYVGMMYGGFLTDKLERYADSNRVLRDMIAYATTYGSTDIGYWARNYASIGNNFYALDQYDSAIHYFQLAITTIGSDKEVNFDILESSLGRLADIYENLSDYVKGQAYNFQALELINQLQGKENSFYGIRLREIASNFYLQENYGASIDYFKQALAVFEKLYSTTDSYYLNAQVYLAQVYRDNDQIQESLSILLGVKKIMESKGMTNSSAYVRCLGELAKSYEHNKQLIESENTYLLSVKMAKSVFGEVNSQYARYVRGYGQYLSRHEKYDQAYQYLSSVLTYAEQTYGKGLLYAWYAADVSNVQMSREKYVEALELREDVAQIYADINSESDDLMNAKYAVAETYRTMGRYPESVNTYTEVAELVKKTIGAFSYAMTQPLTQLAETYWRWKKPEEALKYSIRVKDLYDSLGANRWNYADLYNTMGLLQYELGNIEQAKAFGNLAIHISDSLWGKDAYNSLLFRNNHAFTYLQEGDFETAEQLWLLAGTQFNKKEIGDLSRVRWLDNLATLYTAWDKLDKAAPYWEEVISILLRRITADFSRLSESGKAAFWDANKDNFEFFNTYGIKAAAAGKPEAIGQMYDNQLLTKGLLLSTSTRERRRILNSGDTVLVANYFKYTELKEQLARYYGYTKEQLTQEKVNVSALEQQATRLEKVLSMDAEGLSAEEKSKAIRWRTIQRSLKPGEAAIEIVRFRYFNKKATDSVLYAALILTAETKTAPKLVILPNGNELEDRYVKAYKSAIQFKLKDERSYGQFWRAIDQELKGVKQLYLSLDGVFNQINIGTLLKPDGTYVRDAYSMRLLSSTRDLLLIHPTTRSADRTAYLFGFPKYDLAHSAIEDILEERGISRSRDIDESADLQRFGFTELPGTKTETEEITRLLDSQNWLTNLYLSDKALEEDLKAVSNPSVLHIATHGFFLDDVKKKEGAIELGVRSDVSSENPLLRSGLLLTGAAQTARGEINAGIENGIFTAYEAMNLNLQQTELVVLSACETGRGEIKNGEGVYGLQRAFQIAGAEAIIMSLWKVDDAATQLLMTEFYHAWITGAPKADALRVAQDAVKAKFDHPYYWGAFVLVGQ